MSTPETKLEVSKELPTEQRHEIMPTLFGDGYGIYEVRKGSFVASFILNTAILALLIWLGSWTVTHAPQLRQMVNGPAVDISPYAMPAGTQTSGGGGGGGSHELTAASKGVLPKTAKFQIAPPTVLPMEAPKLPVAPTVVAPPMNAPQVGQMGDPLSKVLGPASNGTGLGGGIGSGNGGGVGSGSGPGVGPGHGGGMGGGAYRMGNGVRAPKLLFKTDPEFSEEARKNKYQGSVTLRIIVGADGKAHDISVLRSLGMGLDEKAVESVRQWRFEPGSKDGLPVPVEVNIEVNFRLY